jgi:hypothetical protein
MTPPRERSGAPTFAEFLSDRYAIDHENRVSTHRAARGHAPGATAIDTADFDDTVLGLNYRDLAPRQVIGDERWAGSLRAFARIAIWCLPAAALALALSTIFGWPKANRSTSLVSPGTWVLFTLIGLALWAAGVTALAALAAGTRTRPWGFVAVPAAITGAVAISPAVGIAGLARPVISQATQSVQNDSRIADVASAIQTQLLSGTGRLLLVTGGVLLAISAVAVAGAVLGSRVLSGHDAWLIIAALLLTGGAAYLSWDFLYPLAAMVLLAGTLGLAYTVSRIAPDGSAPPAY